MKISILAALGMILLAGTATAGPRVFINFGGGGYGCGPRYYSPSVCYAPRPVFYAPRAVYYQPAPVYYSAPVVYAPAYAPVYRAPVVVTGVSVGAVPFRWHR